MPDDDGRLTVSLESIERAVLTQLLREIVQLMESGRTQSAGQVDELAAQLGLADLGTDPNVCVPTPTDPVELRLLPDGYRQDPEAAADFRKFTHESLRQSKIADAEQVLRDLAAGTDDTGTVTIEPGLEQAWLRSLNDLRLGLSARLNLAEIPFEQLHELPDDDPRSASAMVYEFLTWLQDSLLECLVSGLDRDFDAEANDDTPGGQSPSHNRADTEGTD